MPLSVQITISVAWLAAYLLISVRSAAGWDWK
jgi:hypothetical protein